MDHTMLKAFVDEMAKVAANFAAPPSKKTGMGNNVTVSSTSGAGIPTPSLKSDPAKPTNYSIVNSVAPMAAQGTASAVSKAVPPPPVRT